MATGVPYLGSKISLISKSQIRYEGILYAIDIDESTVGLSRVRSFGTEDRPADHPVAPRDNIYDFIIFRGSDIKEIRVCQTSKQQPTLQSGLPNDPAILQHSMSNAGGPPGPPSNQTGISGANMPFKNSGDMLSRSNNAPAAFGPIGTNVGFSAAVSREARGSDSGAAALDILRKSEDSSPVEVAREQSYQTQRQGNNRGGRGGGVPFGGVFQRNNVPRGASRGGYLNASHQHRNDGPASVHYRGGRGARGGFMPGRPSQNKKDTLKFDTEFDFEEANTQFKSVLEEFQKATLEDGSKKEDAEDSNASVLDNSEAVDVVEDNCADEKADNSNDEIYYDKKRSFFDSISCEALEQSKGKKVRSDWRAEKELNKATFGVSTHSGSGYHRGGGRGYYRGGRGFYRGQGYQHQRGGNFYSNGNRYSREQRVGERGGSQSRGNRGYNGGRFY